MTGGNSTDTHSQWIGVAGTSISTTGLTVPSGTTLLLAGLLLAGSSNVPGSPACTWDSVGMNVIATINNSATPDQFVAAFSLVNPTAGNFTLDATWINSTKGYLTAICFSGTDTATGYKSADTVTNTSTSAGPYAVSVNTASGDATVVFAGDTGGGAISATNQTSIFVGTQAAGNAGGSYAIGGSGSNSHTFGPAGSAICSAWIGIRVIAPTVSGNKLLLMNNQGGF